MLQLNSPAASVAGQGMLRGINLNFRVNNMAFSAIEEASVDNLSASLALRSSSRVSADQEFDALFTDNALSNNNILTRLAESAARNTDNSSFASYIKAFTLNGSDPRALSDYEVEGIVNTIAARYAALSRQIEEGSYSDSDKAEMQQSLDSQLESGLEYLSKQFADSASELFDSLKIRSEGANVGTALTEFVKEKKEYYQEFLNSQKGRDYLEKAAARDPELSLDSNDLDLTEVILRHEAEKRAQEKEKEQSTQALAGLKNSALNTDGALSLTGKAAATGATGAGAGGSTAAVGSAGADDKDKELTFAAFTLADLDSLGKLQTSLNSYVTEDTAISEEQLGYQMGLSFVKGKEALKQAGASEHLTSLFENSFENFIDNKVDELNKVMREKQEKVNELSNSKRDSYKDFMLSNVLSAFNATRLSYETTGSTTEAVVSGFESAKASFELNQQNNPTTIRYQDDSFFRSFYTANNDIQGYNMGLSTFRRYQNAMSRF